MRPESLFFGEKFFYDCFYNLYKTDAKKMIFVFKKGNDYQSDSVSRLSTC